jgi:hypothetical protein
MVSRYVEIERQLRRDLRFSFKAVSLAAPHSLQFQLVLSQLRPALVQAMPPVLLPGTPWQLATSEARARTEQQVRRIFDLVFQLDTADEVNVPRPEWARVPLHLVRLEVIHGPSKAPATWLGPRDHGYVAYFRDAQEGPAEDSAEGSRTRHQVRVLLPMYAPPHGADGFTPWPTGPPST